MKLQFTKYGLVNALLTLIPIFPIMSLIPGIFSVLILKILNNSCEFSYGIVKWVAFILSILLVVIYTIRIHKILKNSEKYVKNNFRLWCFFLYALVNTFGLINILGINLACEGDGQTIILAYSSGFIASLTIIIFGFILDIRATVANRGFVQ